MQAFIRIYEYAKDWSWRFACVGDEWPERRRMGEMEHRHPHLHTHTLFTYLFIYSYIYFDVLPFRHASRIYSWP